MTSIDQTDITNTTTTAACTFVVENAPRRFPLEPLAERMGVLLLADGEEGGQRAGQPLESHAVIAARLGVSERTVRRWLGPSDRWRHRPGLSVRQADRYALMVGLMPWQVWSDWWDDVPGEEDLFDVPCRCRPSLRVPVGVECDRCGGRLELAGERVVSDAA
jgi:hypothetical protein